MQQFVDLHTYLQYYLYRQLLF
ncbi:hypothetical protein MTBSS4_10397 [Magnetospirillum sp. SS-4]|nr:hypothetical protein MTBSS4_10397 [Magnetospirillum sp. SS-4]